jgi:hypothetical protein
MLNEIAGHVWWRYIDEEQPDSENYLVYLEVGYSVYVCSRAEGFWREVGFSHDREGFILSAPVGKAILQCVTGPDTCQYILFTDGTALRVFSEPPEPGWVVLCSHAAALLRLEEVQTLLEKYPSMAATPILQNPGRDNETEKPGIIERYYYFSQGRLGDSGSLRIPWFCIDDETGERVDGREEITPDHPQYESWYPVVQEIEQEIQASTDALRQEQVERRALQQAHKKNKRR